MAGNDRQNDACDRPEIVGDLVVAAAQQISRRRHPAIPDRVADGGKGNEAAQVQREYAGRDGNERPDGGYEPAEQDDRRPMPVKPAIDAVYLRGRHGKPVAMTRGEGPQPLCTRPAVPIPYHHSEPSVEPAVPARTTRNGENRPDEASNPASGITSQEGIGGKMVSSSMMNAMPA